MRREPAIDSWLHGQPEDLRSIARPWFERMRACGADVRELMHDGCPTVCVEDAAFGYVNTFRAHANVGFFHGVALQDPLGLLEGTGRFGRHVKLRPGAPVDSRALEALIEAAYLDITARLRVERAQTEGDPAEGAGVTVARHRPAECTPEEREAFSQLLWLAFGVGSGDRSKRIAAARCLVLLREGGELVGIAALKAPTYSQRRAAFAKAGVPFLGSPPRHELGWVVVDERHRGKRYSRLLVESALQAAGGADVFATSHTENTPMHRTLRRSGFTAAGSPWFSRRHGRSLVLFVRPARLSDDSRGVT